MKSPHNLSPVALGTFIILISLVPTACTTVEPTVIASDSPNKRTDARSNASKIEATNQMPLTATLVARWVEHDPLVDDGLAASGTVFAVESRNGRLRMLTNKHCLILDNLAENEADGVEVATYQLSVQFSSGRSKQVRRFGVAKGGLDAAYVEVDDEGLTEGVDFMILNRGSIDSLSIGESVVAVGSPRGLQDTHTFGQVSTLREIGGLQYIQHTAPTTFGNSGGPLLMADNDRLIWIGMNTSGLDGSNQINFAISYKEIMKGSFVWFDANADGAVRALREVYGNNAKIHR